MSESHSLAESEGIFRAILAGGGVFTLHPQGNSMRPTIVPGRDSVSMVRPDGRAVCGDLLFYKRPDGHFVLHRVVSVEPDSYTLCGDNQVTLERGVRDDWVIGVVTAVHRPQGDLVRGTPAWDAAARSRERSRPFRAMRWRAACAVRRIFRKK